LAYFEHLKSKEFLKRQKILSLLREDIIEKYPYGYFVLLLFGSTVASEKPRDIDLLLIIEKTEDIEPAEKALYNS